MKTATLKAATSISAIVLAAGLGGCAQLPQSDSVFAAAHTSVYAVDAGSASNALADGETLEASAETNASIIRSWGNNATQISESEFSIAANANGGLDVTVNGETVSFAPSDAEGAFGYSKVDADGGRQIFSWNGELQPTLDKSNPNYSQAWNYYFWNNAEESQRSGFAVVGTETKSEALENKASATYRGYLAAHAHDNVGGRNRTEFEAGTDPARNVAGASSGIELMADFDAGTISGGATGIVARNRTYDANGNPQTSAWMQVPGSIAFNEANISGNSYSGMLKATDDFPTDLGAFPSYSGRFYGPNAEETAGTFEVLGPDANAVGFFRAFEQ